MQMKRLERRKKQKDSKPSEMLKNSDSSRSNLRETRSSALTKRKRNDFVKNKKMLNVDRGRTRKLRGSASRRRKKSVSARKRKRFFVRNV